MFSNREWKYFQIICQNGCNQEAKQNTTIAVNRLKLFINYGEFTFSTNLGCEQWFVKKSLSVLRCKNISLKLGKKSNTRIPKVHKPKLNFLYQITNKNPQGFLPVHLPVLPLTRWEAPFHWWEHSQYRTETCPIHRDKESAYLNLKTR